MDDDNPYQLYKRTILELCILYWLRKTIPDRLRRKSPNDVSVSSITQLTGCTGLGLFLETKMGIHILFEPK